MKVVIVDDLAEHRKLAEKYCLSYFEKQAIACELASFDDASSLLVRLEKDDLQPDIAILDIELQGDDGLSLAAKLNELRPKCRIIFFTAYGDYAPAAYESDHVWFVLKQSADTWFKPAMDKAIASLKETDDRFLMIKENGSYKKIPLNEIYYLTKVSRKSQICCKDGIHEDNRRPSQIIPNELEDSFIRCHQGYWVNLEMIKELDHNEFVLLNKERIPISRSQKEAAGKAFFARYRLM